MGIRTIGTTPAHPMLTILPMKLAITTMMANEGMTMTRDTGIS
jgi:hypothetical protein